MRGVGRDTYFVIAPAIPPQIASCATFSSALENQYAIEITNIKANIPWKTTVAPLSIHVVPVTAAGLILLFARLLKTSRCSCLTVTAG